MPPIRTDDAPRRLRQVWLGPKGLRLGFEWPYPRLFLFVCLWAALTPVAWYVLGVTGSRVHIAFLLGNGWGLVLSWLASWAIMKGVSADEPLFYRVRMLLAITRPRPIAPVEEVSIELEFPTISEMSPGLRRAITGRSPDSKPFIFTPTATDPYATTTKETTIHEHEHSAQEEEAVIVREEIRQPRPRRSAGFADEKPEARASRSVA